MERIFKYLCMVVTSATLLVSCLSSSDDTVESYSDTAITAITLGTLNRYTQSTSSNTGNDTIIRTTLNGSNYKLTIDQLNRRIYNPDSLPVGTDVRHVVISTLTTKNSGVALIKSMVSDTLFYITTTDSLDFSQPRTIRVLATNGIDYRDYTMTLSVSTSRGTTFSWQRVAQRDDLAGWTDKRLVAFRDTVYLVDRGTIYADNVYLAGPSLLRLDADGHIEGTHSPGIADSWWKIYDAEASIPPIKQLLGSATTEIFAIGNDGRLKVSKDGQGLTWSDELYDDSVSLLPTSALDMTTWPYAPADSTDYILLAGNNEADTSNATLWRKLSRHHAFTAPAEGTWVYMPIDGYNRYTLPRQEYLSMTYYNNNVLALGSNMVLYQSRDQGITWKTESPYSLSEQTGGSRATIAADSQERLWLVTDNGELWLGTLR